VLLCARSGSRGLRAWGSGHNLRNTATGTKLVRDIWPGRDSMGRPNESDSEQLTDVGGTLFFTADDGIHGRELWKAVP
jgi:hypothetical protein